ncbi:MAG: Soluble pyridine nucleotide transhydrogenase [Nitrospira sp.]|jgi:NAD(P) transhydrogenase|nr:MAG: Soluble pyridine nucleotide transhydrogenase [Nitrospira sp.]
MLQEMSFVRTDYDFDLLCIGSGPDAQRAAVQAAKLGKRVAVVEKRPSVEGVYLDMGTIPSKTFREAVCCFLQGNGSFGRCQVFRSESERAHRLSVEELLHRVRIIGRRESEVMEQQLCRNDVRLIRGEVAFVDPHTLLVSSGEGRRTVTVENIVIAVGTYPASPPGVPADGDTILTSDDLAQLRRLPKKLLVVGGGINGIEYASMFAALQIEVILVDKRERLLEFLDSEAVGELMHQMRKQRVTFRLGEAVERLEVTSGSPRQAVVYLESGKSIIADQILFLVGRIGATRRLNLEAVGLKPDERGRLAVDRQFRTTVPHIFAVGDVIGYPSLASTSFSQGGLAACYAFSVETGPMVEHLPIGIYALPEVSAIGPPEHELMQKKIPYVTGIARYRDLARRQFLGDDSGFLKLLFHREDHRLLGVHVVGPGATELVHIGQAVLELGGGLQSFLRAVFNYPKLAECYKVAALDAFNKLSHTL